MRRRWVWLLGSAVAALVAAAWAGSHTRTYLGAQYHRLARLQRCLIARLASLGLRVTVEPLPQAA